ncbi:uncharacterized protein BXZ73DRAFT_47793 [Epithele typhae]|uniref:uncharacterized protein n=1 Tax=Epithele typhae TaxID=378194 RepID=UPI0020080E3E|nr:uncharacterized protein BXZ73DRAFT_47793 [Epithele typhae]KAH9929939.1 hypothetical protein BXZ73DRAFT_47793 [Epithele typhae]
MTIVDNHGPHKFNVGFCQHTSLNRAPEEEPLQLLRGGLWPASWEQPRTAFTMSGLRDFELLSLSTQMSTLDYWKYLTRSKDNVLTHRITTRYADLLEASRLYSFIRLTKRNDVEPSWAMGEGVLGISCPACPQPGINMHSTPPPMYGETDADGYLTGLYIVCDGNFKLVLKMKPADLQDIPLSYNSMYWVNETEAADILESAIEVPKEETTCHQFGAMGYGRYAGRVTGMVGLTCVRHMEVMRNSVVDLTKGEGFKYADLCHLSATKAYYTLPMFISGYDINCQYRKKYDERVAQTCAAFAGMTCLPEDSRLQPFTLGAVGKWHLAAHEVGCRFKFSYNFLPGAAITDGEALERIWAAITGLSARTKEMSPGHRHDVLNHHWNDMNSQRLHKMPTVLAARFEPTHQIIKDLQTHLEELEKGFSKKELSSMKATEAQFLEDVVHMDRHADLVNPYDVDFNRGDTTKDTTKKSIASATTDLEKAVAEPGMSRRDRKVLTVLCEGVDLEKTRRSLLDQLQNSTDDEKASIESTRSKFLERYAKWANVYDAHIQPALEDAAENVSVDGSESNMFPRRPESYGDVGATSGKKKQRADAWTKEIEAIDIPMPSNYEAIVLAQSPAQRLAELEMKVRRQHAQKCLEVVRTHLILMGALSGCRRMM